MITYLADWVEGKEVFSVHFKAPDRRIAENIARKRGWVLVGEYIDEQDCPDDVFAMIEKRLFKPSIH